MDRCRFAEGNQSPTLVGKAGSGEAVYGGKGVRTLHTFLSIVP